MQLYQLKFPNGKSYIGITSKTSEERFKRHCHPSKRNNPCQRAIHKFGIDNVVLTVLATVDNWELLCLAEIEGIEKYDTFDVAKGYNLTLGGEGNLTINLLGEERINRDKKVEKARGKAYYASNKRERSEYDKEYRSANRDKLTAKRKERYAANKDKISAQRKKYALANKEKIAEYMKIYNAGNRGKINARKKEFRFLKKLTQPNEMTFLHREKRAENLYIFTYYLGI